jgi:ubiquinone/menaquinone biosynthesis C-methylase UbiE
VINVSVLHLLGDPVSTLREFERCLKPGGYAIIVHYPKRKCHAQPSAPSEIPFIKAVTRRAKAYIEKKGFSRYWTCAELKNQIQKTHLEITEADDNHPIVIVARKPVKG